MGLPSDAAYATLFMSESLGDNCLKAGLSLCSHTRVCPQAVSMIR